MPSVDWLNQASNTAEAAQLRSTNDRNRQTWLKALEEAGLRDALRVTRQFVSAGFSSSFSERREPHAPPAWQDSGSFSEETPRFPTRNDSGGSIEEAGSALASGRMAGARSSQQASQTLSPPTDISRPVTNSDAPGQETGPEPAKRSVLLAPSSRVWQARNIAVLPSGQGAEVWIRDSTMTESGLVTLLSGLRNSMAELGTSLVRVSLNGKPVYSPPAQSKPGERKSKEG